MLLVECHTVPMGSVEDKMESSLGIEIWFAGIYLIVSKVLIAQRTIERIVLRNNRHAQVRCSSRGHVRP